MLSDEFRPQNKALDALVTAVDFLRIASEPDRFNDRAPAKGLSSSLHLEVLYGDDTIAIRKHVANRIAQFVFLRQRGSSGGFGDRDPFAGSFVINIVI